MADVANQDEAKKCLEIASSNLQSGHLDKAHRFAEKAMKLFPCDEARTSFMDAPAAVSGLVLTLARSSILCLGLPSVH